MHVEVKMKKRGAMSKSQGRTVVRSSKTGRFVKQSAAKLRPDVAKVEAIANPVQLEVELVRSTRTGRFVKKATAKRNPESTVIERIKR